MVQLRRIFFISIFLFLVVSEANPHWNDSIIPSDAKYLNNKEVEDYPELQTLRKAQKLVPIDTKALRITVAWDATTESYRISNKVIENSGTASLLLRSKKISPYGSYKGQITDTFDRKIVYYDSIGTGKEYRKLVRGITFRFPLPKNDFTFQMQAEHPIKGNLEKVLEEKIKLTDLKLSTTQLKDVDVRQLKAATVSPALEVVFYAEGYKINNKDNFFKAALKAMDTLKSAQVPGFENMNFVGVFTTSNQELKSAVNLGLPIQRRDSAFGLYFPYWSNFGRWYHVIYPTDENYFRTSLAVVPYDYNIMLVDTKEYWGVANYKTHTAIPARNGSFKYLLLHELGHFFGLNEEYDGGGRTELEFAPQIKEVWSQNMTFLPEVKLEKLKWKDHVIDPKTPVPTPDKFWKTGRFGAYVGGYGDSNYSSKESYKPGRKCVMDTEKLFCNVCSAGIKSVVDFDLGRSSTFK